jgi:hypothetical protein
VGDVVVHFLKGVDDEINRRLDVVGDTNLAIKPVFQCHPVFSPVAQTGVVDDDQQIIVRLVALGGVRLVDPAAARIAAVEHQLLDARPLFPGSVGERQNGVEFLEDDLTDAFSASLAVFGAEVLETAAHDAGL